MDLQSLGHAAAMFQENPRVIEACLKAVGAKPILRLNGLPYYQADNVVSAVKYLAEHNAKMAMEKKAKEVDHAE